jgi:hypothetical protein
VLEAVAVELAGMPEAVMLRRTTVDGETTISFGKRLLFRYAEDDTGMRNMAIVALTDAGVPGLEAALVFDLTAPYISRIRGVARSHGADGLVRKRGRPPKLSPRQVANARRLAAAGETHARIAARYGVARSVISELLARFGPLPTQEQLGGELSEPGSDEGDGDDVALDGAPPEDAAVEDPGPLDGPSDQGLARIATGVYPSRYAGASLLYAYLDMVGAGEVFSTLSGGGPRRYDDLSVLCSVVMGFALGIGSVEGAKHLRRSEAGALVGVHAIPELRTLRERLSLLADGADPLALQRQFAKRTLAADPPTSPVYYVDDHFVAYTGARPVAKGWNTKRRHAEPGRDDTLVCDDRGRAVVFSSSEPSSLATTMLGVLDQLREVIGPDQRVMLGFDRGGSYAKAFSACRTAEVDWVSYRRGRLAATAQAPKRSWAMRHGRRVVVSLADEIVDISDYGRARQLTLYERGQAVLQVLTSDMTAGGAALLLWLRGRWSIENFFKYAAAHSGIDQVSSYLMDTRTDDRLVANPRRTAARAVADAAASALADAERALAQLLCDPDASLAEMNAGVDGLQRAVAEASEAHCAARGALKAIAAKVPATDLDPGAKRATMRPERRGLQMVCRLLAFNAESWLAEHFDAYLGDQDENRAIMRNLLHLGGSFSYQHGSITVTLERPDSPRVARALELLVEELSSVPVHLLGDRRPLSYKVASASLNCTSGAERLPEV